MRRVRRCGGLFLGLVAFVTGCSAFTGTDVPPANDGRGVTGNGADGGGADGGGASQDGGKASGPPLSYKRVFVTSKAYKPDSLGLDPSTFSGVSGETGADGVCDLHATLGQKTGTGTYRPWLSTSASTPAQTFTKSSEPYKLVDGTTIASSWDALVHTGVQSPISLDEDGNKVTGTAWTATKVTGDFDGTANCSDWTSGSGASTGSVGSTTSASSWSGGATSPCNAPQHIYCFEQ